LKPVRARVRARVKARVKARVRMTSSEWDVVGARVFEWHLYANT